MPRRTIQLDADGLYQRAVRALARRGRTELEMRRLLQPRARTPEAVEMVMERLREYGYLNDAQLAATVALYQKDVFRHGRNRALRDLRTRGVDAATAAEAVSAGYAGANEDGLVRAYLRKKRCLRPQSLREAAKLYRKLLHAGFSPAACQRGLRGWQLDPEWLEAIENMEAGALTAEPETTP